MGLDPAASNSGLVIVDAESCITGGHVKLAPLYEFGAVHSPLNDHRPRAQFSEQVVNLCKEYDVALVAMEGYIMRGGKTNTTAYQHGETVGMIKKGLNDIGISLIIIAPSSMRYFVGVPRGLPDSGKSFIIDFAKNNYDFESTASTQNKRSNVTDAFIHSILGSIMYFYMSKVDIGELSGVSKSVLLGDNKKQLGLLNTPNSFFGCPWYDGKPKIL